MPGETVIEQVLREADRNLEAVRDAFSRLDAGPEASGDASPAPDTPNASPGTTSPATEERA